MLDTLLVTLLAERLSNIKPSFFMAQRAAELKAAGQPVIAWPQGPDFDTPDFIKEASYAAIKAEINTPG